MQKLDESGNVKEISVWQKTHNNDLLDSTYRLYLTATPRIYSDKAKDNLKEKSQGNDLSLFSMDDEATFGKEIYSLRFHQAIKQNLLSDYRVVISYMRKEYLAEYLGKLTKAQEKLNLTLEDAGKMVAFSHALKKRNLNFVDENGAFENYVDDTPMRRAVAFHRSIRNSKVMTSFFSGGESPIDKDTIFTHIDGTDNAYAKSKKLGWLAQDLGEQEARVLSNAKCLTEGIDVPSLDAVCFFDKRDSVVDIVQAVGRAIRKSDGKKYGYIILPLVLSDEEIKNYNKTLNEDKFKIVWQTLKALRSHDERLIDEARIAEVVSISAEWEPSEIPESLLFSLSELFTEMKNAVPKNLGDLQYWENYASKVGDIMQALILRIQALLDSSPAIQELFAIFCKALQSNLNASFDERQAIALVAQHIITKPIFECIFPSLDFTTFDKVSAELEKLHSKLLEQGLNAETKTLEKFYTSVRQSAEYAKSDKSKQSLIKNLYNTLFKKAFKKTQEKLGIVYTPIEGVDFIVHSTQYLLQKHFGKSLGDEHIHIADPFTGTGTFITRTIQSGYLDSRLESKFAKELWANEITLLGYYIAQINIATTYHERLLYLRDSVLSDKSAIASRALRLHTPSMRPCTHSQSPDFSSQSLESQGGDTTLESTFETRILEEDQASQSSARADTPSPSLRGDTIAEAVHKSTQVDSSVKVDCHADKSARNDKNLNEQAKDSRICENTQSVATQQAEAKVDSRTSPSDSKILSERAESAQSKQAQRRQDFGDKNGALQGQTWELPKAVMSAGSPQQSPFLAQKPTPEIKLFDNLLFTDTFNTYAPDSKGFKGKREDPKLFDSEYLEKNYAKIQEFKNTEFKIFMSNPPYSAGQKSANDDNANEKSPHIDKRISETYRAKSLATSTKNTSFDSFKRALRFMSDRIGESGGIIGLVVNGSFLESNSDDGLRACLADEFDYIYIFNLRGNQRTSGETSRKEGGKFFDSGSRTPVAICFFVKLDSSAESRNDDKTSPLSHCETSAGSLGNPQPSKAKIYYYDIGDYLDRQTKLNIIQNFKSIESMEAQGLFTLITPNKDYDWINQRDYSFMTFTPMGSTGQKLKPLAINAKGELELEIFEIFSQGVVTGKDNWSFNFSKENLAKNIALCIDTYNTEREALAANPAHKLCNDLSKVTWGGSLDKRVRANRELVFDESRIRVCSYRPFTKEFLYFDNGYSHSHCQMDKIYPFGNKGEAIACINGGFENVMIALNDRGGGDFGALLIDDINDIHFFAQTQNFPLYYYERVESNAENGQMTMDYDLAESSDNALSPSLRGGGKATNEAIHKNTDSSAEVDCHDSASAESRNDDNTAYYRRKDAIRDEALAFFQNAYNDSTITKEDMFYYIYAILNHPAYIAKYKDNLSKMLPRIPLMQDFWGFVASGRALAGLHINYESYNKPDSRAFACLAKDLQEFKTSAKGLFEKDFRQKAKEDIEHLSEEDFRIETIKFHTKGVKDSILLNDKIAIVNIPHKAYAYKVNGKSAIEWILDRYKISTDKASGIVNDPNLYESTSGALAGLKGGRYVCALLLSIIEMSVRTSEVLESMPEYKLLES